MGDPRGADVEGWGVEAGGGRGVWARTEGWGGLRRASSFRMRKPGTNRVGWRHSLRWGPGLPGPSRWTPKPLSSGHRPKNPCAKPSANPGQ